MNTTGRQHISAERQQRWMVAFWLLFILANMQVVFAIWLAVDKKTSPIRGPNPYDSGFEQLAWFWVVPGYVIDLVACAVLAIFGLIGFARARKGYSAWSWTIAVWLIGHAVLVALNVEAMRMLPYLSTEKRLLVWVFRIVLANIVVPFWLFGLWADWFEEKKMRQTDDERGAELKE
jgi:hypothetical protein